MVLKIISGIFILLSVYIGLSHGSRVFQKPTVEYQEMMSSLGITNGIRLIFGISSILAALLILAPQTFFLGNVLRAVLLVFMMALALKAGNFKFALIEIPFLLIPFLLIYLDHPFKNGI